MISPWHRKLPLETSQTIHDKYNTCYNLIASNQICKHLIIMTCDPDCSKVVGLRDTRQVQTVHTSGFLKHGQPQSMDSTMSRSKLIKACYQNSWSLLQFYCVQSENDKLDRTSDWANQRSECRKCEGQKALQNERAFWSDSHRSTPKLNNWQPWPWLNSGTLQTYLIQYQIGPHMH